MEDCPECEFERSRGETAPVPHTCDSGVREAWQLIQESFRLNSGLLDPVLWTLVRAVDMPCMVIFEDGGPYLARFYLSRRPPGREDDPAVYLHYFFSSDEPGWYHNHPWQESHSLILTGGYREHFFFPHPVRLPNRQSARQAWPRTSVLRRPGDLARIERERFHRVELVDGGCWTLFIAGRRASSWEYWCEGTGRFEDWEARNQRVKGDRSVERMTARDPRLSEYLERSRRS